jgi:hypothetical protein
VFCAKKAVNDRQKDQLKILKRVNKELLQRLSQETNLSFGTVQLILKKDLHFFLYRVSVVHEINSLTILIVGALAPKTDNNLSG